MAIMFVVVARLAGPDDFGGLVAAIAAASFLAGLFDFGTNNLWVRETVSRRMTFDGLYENMTSKFLLTLPMSILATAIPFLFLADTQFYATGILAFSMAFFQSLQVPLKVCAAGIRLSIALSMERLFAAAVFAVLLTLDVEVSAALVSALATGSIAAGIAAYWLTPFPARRMKLHWRPIWPWSGSTSYGLSGVTLSAQSLDSIILHAVAGPVATGIYGAVNKWTRPLEVFAGAFATAGLPFVAESKSLRKSYRALRHAWWLLGAAASLCLLVAVLAPQIVSLLLGPEYAGSAAVLTILALGAIPALMNQPLYVFMQAMNLDKAVATALAWTVGLQLCLCGLLGFLYAETGAALAYAITQGLLLATFARVLILSSRSVVTA